MSNVTGTIRGRATIEQATNPTIYNVSVPLAETETSQVLSDETKAFLIRVRGGSSLKLSFSAGMATFVSIGPGASYSMDGLNYSGTLYFKTSNPAQIVEIIEWV